MERLKAANGNFEKTYNSVGFAAAAALVRNLTPSQVAKLPNEMVANPVIAKEFTPPMLVALQEEKKLRAGDITSIGNAIRANGSPAAQNYVSGNSPGAAFWT